MKIFDNLNPKLQKKYIKDIDLLRTIAEIVYNMQKQRFNLDDEQYRHLKQHSLLIKKLNDDKTDFAEKSVLLSNKKGLSFLSLLFEITESTILEEIS
jgi:4-hydroxyphenylpyruvate dioxygenase-like putative hemolysin